MTKTSELYKKKWYIMQWTLVAVGFICALTDLDNAGVIFMITAFSQAFCFGVKDILVELTKEKE